MSVDLIELALERFTDWTRFEALAGDILRDEGYADIKIIGGMHDEGRDALVERFFSSSGTTMQIVFQFSLQQDVARKVSQTVARLRKAGVPFQKLVIATTVPITAEHQRRMVVDSRKEGVDLEIFERRTIANRLGDPALLARYFPDIQAQVRSLTDRPARVSEADREREQLKVCCGLLFSEEATRSRDALVDAAVLSLLSGRSLRLPEIVEAAKGAFKAAILAPGQIAAALTRLGKQGLARRRDDSFELAQRATVQIEGVAAATASAGQAVCEEIVANVEAAHGSALPDVHKRQLVDNCREVFAEYFRANGLEIARTFAVEQRGLAYAEAMPRFEAAARRRVPAHLGALLSAAIGNALATPTAEQASYFARYSRAYVALQILNCDPALREFEVTRFKSKAFVLDTDFVLHALVSELPLSPVYRRVVRDLLAMGARVVVPTEVVEEVVSHLRISPRTFDYFGASLNGMTEEIAAARIWNALVRGYWYASVAKGRPATRDGFLRFRDNYFDVETPQPFVMEALREALPSTEAASAASLSTDQWDQAELVRLTRVLEAIARSSPKGPDRTEEQIRDIASVDAKLFLALQGFNRSVREGAGILGGRAYVVTSSGRLVRAAQAAGVPWAYSARPGVLVSLMELVAPRDVSDSEYVALFENPLLQRTVEDAWPDVKVMLDAGLDLQGKSLTRLKGDLEEHLHAQITRVRDAEREADRSGGDDERAEDAADAEQARLLAEARALGYRAVPILESLLELGAGRAEERARLLRENEELRARVTRYGRKHERWLRRMERRS